MSVTLLIHLQQVSQYPYFKAEAHDRSPTGQVENALLLNFHVLCEHLRPGAVSVAGTHSTRDISELQIAPTLNLDLPGSWFLTLYPSYDIRINYGDPVSGQTGRLFLPADAEIGYKLSDAIVLGF